jgi:hypothetical protein
VPSPSGNRRRSQLAGCYTVATGGTVNGAPSARASLRSMCGRLPAPPPATRDECPVARPPHTETRPVACPPLIRDPYADTLEGSASVSTTMHHGTECQARPGIVAGRNWRAAAPSRRTEPPAGDLSARARSAHCADACPCLPPAMRDDVSSSPPHTRDPAGRVLSTDPRVTSGSPAPRNRVRFAASSSAPPRHRRPCVMMPAELSVYAPPSVSPVCSRMRS